MAFHKKHWWLSAGFALGIIWGAYIQHYPRPPMPLEAFPIGGV